MKEEPVKEEPLMEMTATAKKGSSTLGMSTSQSPREKKVGACETKLEGEKRCGRHAAGGRGGEEKEGGGERDKHKMPDRGVREKERDKERYVCMFRVEGLGFRERQREVCYACLYLYDDVCVYACGTHIYIYVHTHTHTHTHTYTHTHTGGGTRSLSGRVRATGVGGPCRQCP